MSRNLKVAAAAIVIVLLGLAAFMVLGKNVNTINDQTAKQAQEQNTSFTSIQDAMTKSVSLKCDYVKDDGKHVVAYIKNGMIKVLDSDKGSATNMVIRDRKMYFWGEQGAFVMDISSSYANSDPNKAVSNPDQVISALESYKDKCIPADISDSEFTIPTNLQFQDYSSFMK